MNTSKRIAIIGGGLAGLAAAHVLAQFPGFDITLIEKNEVCGGLVRSSVDDRCPSQYCWHVFGSEYKMLRTLLSQIPDERGKTLVDHLVPIQHCLASHYDISTFPQLLRYLIDVFGIANLLQFIWKCIRSKPEEVRHMTWLEFISDDQPLTETQIRVAADVWSPILGIDPFRGSASSVLQILQTNPWLSNPVPFKVFDGPTTPDLFLKWQRLLESRGVRILTLHRAVALDTTDGFVRGVWIQPKNESAPKLLETEALICAIPPMHAASLLPVSLLKKRLTLLSSKMSIRQVSIPLFLKKPLHFKHPRSIMLIADAPWSMVIEPIPAFWTRANLAKNLPKSLGSYLEIGLGNPYKPGVLSGKPWVRCSLKEIQDELWFQLLRAFTTQETEYIGNLHNNAPLGIIMWHDFQWINGEWRTLDDKRSSNAGTWTLRPHHPQTDVPFRNLWLAGDYMRSSPTEVVSMESATLSGVRAGIHLAGSVNPLNLKTQWD